jgi:hypothetical protein
VTNLFIQIKAVLFLERLPNCDIAIMLISTNYIECLIYLDSLNTCVISELKLINSYV